jgi:hypothetical protein
MTAAHKWSFVPSPHFTHVIKKQENVPSKKVNCCLLYLTNLFRCPSHRDPLFHRVAERGKWWDTTFPPLLLQYAASERGQQTVFVRIKAKRSTRRQRKKMERPGMRVSSRNVWAERKFTICHVLARGRPLMRRSMISGCVVVHGYTRYRLNTM